MIGAKHRFANISRALVQRQGVGIAALAFVEIGKVVQRTRDVGMIASEQFFADRQRPLDQRLGVTVAALDLVDWPRLLRSVATAGCSGPAAFW